jgi:hypothetical protein
VTLFIFPAAIIVVAASARRQRGMPRWWLLWRRLCACGRRCATLPLMLQLLVMDLGGGQLVVMEALATHASAWTAVALAQHDAQDKKNLKKQMEDSAKHPHETLH